MMSTAQPLQPHEVPAWIHDVLDVLGAEVRHHVLTQVRCDRGHSNDIYELEFGDGRVLLVKRGRHDWVRRWFAASGAAARLITTKSDMIVPRPLRLPHEPADVPLQVYWRIPLPTLASVWRSLTPDAQASAVRSLGSLVRRLHEIEVPEYGPLHDAVGGGTLGGAIERDLRERLLPAIAAHWPSGLYPLECLLEQVDWVQQLGAARPSVLVHNDLHAGNVLCRVRDGRVECVGFIDLDAAVGSVSECDLASFEILHGTLFQQHLHRRLRLQLRLGYGDGVEERVVEFFQCAHLANQGFSSALLGHEEHAERIGTELRRRLKRLDRGGRRAGAAREQRLGAGGDRRNATGISVQACSSVRSSTSTSMTR